jgi:hypothetical protein
MVHRPYQCVKQQYWRGFATSWPVLVTNFRGSGWEQNLRRAWLFRPGGMAAQDWHGPDSGLSGRPE